MWQTPKHEVTFTRMQDGHPTSANPWEDAAYHCIWNNAQSLHLFRLRRLSDHIPAQFAFRLSLPGSLFCMFPSSTRLFHCRRKPSCRNEFGGELINGTPPHSEFVYVFVDKQDEWPNEPESKLLVSPLITPKVNSYTIPHVTCFKEFRP